MHHHGIAGNVVAGIGAPVIALIVSHLPEVKEWLQILALVLACTVSVYSIISMHIKIRNQTKGKTSE